MFQIIRSGNQISQHLGALKKYSMWPGVHYILTCLEALFGQQFLPYPKEIHERTCGKSKRMLQIISQLFCRNQYVYKLILIYLQIVPFHVGKFRGMRSSSTIVMCMLSLVFVGHNNVYVIASVC